MLLKWLTGTYRVDALKETAAVGREEAVEARQEGQGWEVLAEPMETLHFTRGAPTCTRCELAPSRGSHASPAL